MLIHKKITLKKSQSSDKQRGFTLIEVMIAAFVLSVGMLGSTAMMLRGVQISENTNEEAVASQLATNMAERMRANIEGVAGVEGVDANGDPVVSYYYDNLNADAGTSVDCSSTTCSSEEVALYHAYIWGQELEDLLPGNPTGTVRAVNPSTQDSVFTITINWSTLNRLVGTTHEAIEGTGTYVMIFQP